MARTPTIFLLSPAQAGGKRARLVKDPAPIGEVFALISGLYFRGKLAYSREFAHPPRGVPGALVITPTRGLVPADTPIGPADLAEFAGVPVRADDPRYREPLARSAAELAARCPANTRYVLLGSIATPKYLDVLSPHLPLHVPARFVGLGDMSRGSLMLSAVTARAPLKLISVAR